MKKTAASRSNTLFARLRPWILPAAFLITLFSIMGGTFDVEALRADLADGNTEDALQLLSTTPRDELPPDIADVRWWPLGARELRLRTLREQADADPDESYDYPTIVAPLDALRHPPTEFRLREPAQKALILDIENQDLGLEVASLPIPAGTQQLPTSISWIPGTAFVMSIREADTGHVKAIARFDLLPGPQAESIGRAMRTAHDLAPGGPSPAADLLTALVALHHGLHEEAVQRLDSVLAESPADSEAATIARELRAIAWAEQGLDLSALASLDG